MSSRGLAASHVCSAGLGDLKTKWAFWEARAQGSAHQEHAPRQTFSDRKDAACEGVALTKASHSQGGVDVGTRDQSRLGEAQRATENSNPVGSILQKHFFSNFYKNSSQFFNSKNLKPTENEQPCDLHLDTQICSS